MTTELHIRRASRTDRDWLFALQEVSLHVLGRHSYDEAAIGSFVAHGGISDDRMIDRGTCFVALSGGTIVGCGGWSDRTGKTGVPAGALLLRPAPRMRGLFVHPTFARRGIGSRLVRAIEDDMVAAGHDCATLAATLNSADFFRALGYCGRKTVSLPLPGRRRFAVTCMSKRFAGVDAAAA
ncbi:MAG: GNAT family N-acetyltransferase [Pseudorhodoplanes sp.]|nr:GNAT family N-acetyltransferase [Pseudorhodoplanes sp.]